MNRHRFARFTVTPAAILGLGIPVRRLGLVALGVALLATTGARVFVSGPSALAAPAAAEKPAQAVNKKSFPGLPDPGKPVALLIETAGAPAAPAAAGKPAVATLRGPDARLQFVVTGKYDSGQVRDWTHQVTYAAQPANVVRIEPTGTVIPLADGRATVTVKGPGGLSASADLAVQNFANPLPVNFRNQVVPIFTKLGCNSGGCHGKSGGQNGFRLSLLGFEPHQDYGYLVKEGRGRRLFPAAPAESLLLLKATNMLAHGGGERLKLGSADYQVIYRWISQGMPYGSEGDPRIVAINVSPDVRVMPPDGRQQLKVTARFSDGGTEDVTHNAQYEPNDKEMAEINESGAVKMMGRPGDVAVMVRYQGQVSTFRATVPLGAPVTKLPPARNFVDELVFEKLKSLGLPPSGVCDDTTFVRRVTLDLTGRLPTAAEAKAFLADTDAAKRDKLIDRLLASEDHADYFASKWGSILRNKRERETFQRGNYLFHEWIKGSLLANKPYDQFVRELLTAAGDASVTPAVTWYRQADEINEQVEDTAQLFLGVRIQCARCHHHPFEKWSQDDYYGIAAFFSQVGKKDGSAVDEFRIYHKRGEAQAQNPATGKNVKPTGLGAEPLEISPLEDPRGRLVDWMVQKQNPLFSKSLVNRYWKHFFGRGLVDPEDDMRETNPPSNPKLLDALAAHFSGGGYDMRDLVRTICQSQTYQLASAPNEYNHHDRQSFSRFFPRRLQAEVLLDAIDQVNGTKTTFTGMPDGARATELPDHGGVDNYFLQVFGRPAGASACECERAGDTSLAQSLHLLNSNDIYEKLGNGLAATMASAEDKRADEQKVTELYYAAFSRPPSAGELKQALDYIAQAEQTAQAQEKTPPQNANDRRDKRTAYEDLVWALINTKEFLFNH